MTQKKAKSISAGTMSREDSAIMHQPGKDWWVHGSRGWQFFACSPPDLAYYFDDRDCWLARHGDKLPLPTEKTRE